MSLRKKKARDGRPVSFRLETELQEQLMEQARREDLSFSQLIRRAVRRELATKALSPAIGE